MRVRRKRSGVSVHAISGTYVVLLGLDADEAAREGLLGFAIEREDHTEDERYWLKGFKTFEETEPDPCPGSLFSTLEHPIQTFLWGDYTAKPDHEYTYRVRPVRGQPKQLEYGPDVTVRVKTERVDLGEHAIYFNRGAIASQAYARKFQNRVPDVEDLSDGATAWLSRGLMEAALDFIAEAQESRFGLRVAAYEFNFPPILEALQAAAGRGADVKIVYEAGSEKKRGVLVPTSTTKANERAIDTVGLDRRLVKGRTKRKAIPHNKFIVLLENDVPIQVWTGSTNFTPSGFLGQSNVGHVVRNRDVAQLYLGYWEQLADDAEFADLRAWNAANTPFPKSPLSEPITPLFSPRPRSRMLDWYADRIGQARQTVMLTAAFGVNKKLAQRFAEDRDFLRFIITEKALRGEAADLIKRDRDTRVAVGSTLGVDARRQRIPGWELDEWYMREEHFRRVGQVFYVHTKYMLVDVLTDDPLVFSGSANFSTNSLLNNDENMLLIRGNQAVADIYLGEFVRLFNHFYFRTIANRLAQEDSLEERRAAYLDASGKWIKSYFTRGRYHNLRRELFR
jgi:phosphatidylserine/phosphatidylglycerophosphate/cardiolipin synthase-like enzyme